MSQTERDRPSVLRAARERTRAEITREILAAARRHLATDGASGLSLRAIARELGMSSSAVYGYVASRDELLTRLIVTAYDTLGNAAETQEAAVDREDLAGRWAAACGAVRGWALANPNEYALIYGTPVPGYIAPPPPSHPPPASPACSWASSATSPPGAWHQRRPKTTYPPTSERHWRRPALSSGPRCPTSCCTRA